ncbi:MAG: type IV toxin-antitoxin system AbiEi family antitoxin domain-containing protein [Actinomycetota bacterium]|nr:type IV toxin-antitoxin system AbiEi family antitoxin domain-containing protein [Actinomycetota bacterium]
MQANRTKLSTQHIDAALRQIALPQLGIVTLQQAARRGVDRFALARRRECGALVEVFPGVLRLASVGATAEQRILAAALAVPRSRIAATAAALVHQLPARVHHLPPTLTVEPGRSPRTPGIVTIRQRVELPSQRWHSVPVATPAATLLLLPRFIDDTTVERCLDHCLAHRLTTVAKVSALIDLLPAQAIVGRRLLVDLLAERSAGIGHRSGLEQRVARWLNDAGLQGWQRNHRVSVDGGRTVEVDFAWPARKVALEVSPFFTHGSRSGQERDLERRRLLVVRGWRVLEATDPDLESRSAFSGCILALESVLGGRVDQFVRAV